MGRPGRGARPFTGTQLEVALAHRDRPLPPLPASVAADVTAFVMHLTAKDPGSRPRDAAEAMMWAALLRDGNGAAPVTAHQSAVAPPLNRAQARRRTVLVCSCAAVAAVIVIVMASVIGFASPWHPVTASSAPTPSSSAALAPRDSTTAPSSHRPATDPSQPPAAGPATKPSAPVVPVVSTTHPGNNGNGPGSDNGVGNGNGPGSNNGVGNGNGKGNGKGNAQGDGSD